jgi:hypothetical protein
VKRQFIAIAAGFLALLGLPAGAETTTVESYAPLAAKAAPAAPTRSHNARAKRVKQVILGTPAADAMPNNTASTAARFGVPLQIGFGRAVPGYDRDVAAQLDWDQTAEGTQVAALSITSPNAAALRIGVLVDSLPAEAMLRFYAQYGETLYEVSGQEILETIARNVAAGDDSSNAHTYWAPPVDAPAVTMEIELPATARPSQVRIGTPHVTHMITSASRNFEMPKVDGTVEAAAACENDAMCSTATWGSQMNAVARMQFNVGASGYYCTGTLLGNTGGTATPYFLTANHCISDATSASTLQTDWFFRSASCGSASAGAYQVLNGGATLLYHSATTDTSFLRLNGNPPAGVTFAGWQVSSVPPVGSGITAIHQPRGDWEKISFGSIGGYTVCTAPDSLGRFSCTNPSSVPTGATFYEAVWSSGITEPGSSGSALFSNTGKYVIGQLYGGSSNCTNIALGELYGRLDVAYNAAGGLSQYLNPAIPSLALTISKSGTGAGTVTSSPGGVTCGTTCSGMFTQDSTVVLTAAATPGSLFAGWSGACSGTINTCSVTMSTAKSATATFNLAPPVALTVSRIGAGTGSITSTPAGISCGSTCSTTFPAASLVTLTATPSGLSSFAGWSGACSGTGSCSVTLNSATSVTANFAPPPILSITKGGTGTGTVTSTTSGISCGATCSSVYPPNNLVSLTAVADAGSVFAGWGGACTGTRGCAVSMTASKDVTATFNLAVPRTSTYVLTVTPAGTGAGVVTSNPAGISCGLTCSAMMAANVSVIMTATPSTGSTFAGWSGACSGTGFCTVPMSAATSVTATFNVTPPTGTNQMLTIVPAGTGSGSVVSAPAGIDCGATCSGSFPSGTMVRLTATPAMGSTFAGFSGACVNTRSTCSITLNAAATVTVTFNGNGTPPPPPPTMQTLSVSLAGTGSGSVASSPAGISCGATCSANFTTGTMVSLTPTAASGSTFGGWSGACSGTGACTVTLNAASSVMATFTASTPPPPGGANTLTISKLGAGASLGTVTSNSGGINCGATCSADYAAGTSVTLSAVPGPGRSFGGWSGGCVGTRLNCMLPVNAATTVTATFN